MEMRKLELVIALCGVCSMTLSVHAQEAAMQAQDTQPSVSFKDQEVLKSMPGEKVSDAAIKQSNYDDLSFTVEDTTQGVDVADEPEEGASNERKFDINFDSTDIIDVINQFSTERGVNILVPTGANEIKSKLTLKLDERVTLDEAEKLLCTVLDIAGYSMVRRQDGFTVVKNDNNIARSPLPIFVGMSPDELPDSDERIRYFYYFSNIQVPAIGAEGQSEINTIFQQLLPADAIYKYVPSSNGVLLVDKSKNIKAAMNIIRELDKVGFKENLEIVHLNFTNAQVVADLFNNNILGASDQQTNRLRVGFRGKSQAEYFSTAMKLIPEIRTNSLILLGTQQSIDRVKDFIFRYVDVRLESGNSILHTYQLQYLEAATFAKTLEQLVTGAAGGGTGQSRAGGPTGTGPERFFEGVVIRADTPATPVEGAAGPRYFGGNQLVVAARNEDWLRIKKLIEELDRPQPQVIIEVLIADLQITDEHVFGAHTRMPSSLNLPNAQHPNGSIQFQSAASQQALATTLADGGPNVNVDLLNKDGYKTAGGATIPPLQTSASGGTLDNGTTVISLNDSNGNTWSILQILQSYENSKILAHPHVVATNNQEALVEIGEIRMLKAEATIGQGGAAIAKLAEKTANMTVKITPRISGGEIVNMQVTVKFNEFVGETSDRIDRQVVTNANVQSGTILALGGLIKVDTQQGLTGTPLLSRIPILGYFFKKRTGMNTKNNLTVFIRPTIVMPRLRGGIDRYTKDYIDVAKKYVDENMLFDTLRDPITRWFFSTGVDAKSAMDTFATDTSEKDEDWEMIPEEQSKVDTTKAVAGNLRNDPTRTVLAAAEHRKPKKTKVLEMKNDLMDYSSKRDATVVARNDDNKPQEGVDKAPRDEKRKATGQTTEVAQTQKPKTIVNTPIAATQETKVAVAIPSKKQPAPVQKAPVNLTREEQLKKLLSQQDNPLLTV